MQKGKHNLSASPIDCRRALVRVPRYMLRMTTSMAYYKPARRIMKSDGVLTVRVSNSSLNTTYTCQNPSRDPSPHASSLCLRPTHGPRTMSSIWSTHDDHASDGYNVRRIKRRPAFDNQKNLHKTPRPLYMLKAQG